MKKTTTIAEIAAAVALCTILSFISIMKMPQGGSVSLTMLPILIISFRRGAGAGIVTGLIFGVLFAFIDGYIFHPASLILDYALAFAVIGIAGFFPKKLPFIILGMFLGILGRFCSSCISGAIFFASYAPAGQNPWLYSTIYQASYMLPELLLCIVSVVIIFFKAPAVFNPSNRHSHKA